VVVEEVLVHVVVVDAVVVDAVVVDAVVETKQESGSQSPNWAVWFKLERSTLWTTTASLPFPLRSPR
jgi:hypothetical protein